MNVLRAVFGPVLLGLMLSLAACADGDGGGTRQDVGGDTEGDVGQDPTTDPGVDQPDQAVPVCGDGAVNGSEVCDGSAPDDGCPGTSTCNASCTACIPAGPSCGDGAVNGAEACDGSAPDDGCDEDQHCNATCTACIDDGADDCGDGFLTGEEECDESATITGCGLNQECNATCTACVDVPFCGDGALSDDEVCDASSLLDDGCPIGRFCNDDCSECVADIGPRCGDGRVNGGELCDASAILNTGCSLPQRCNDTCTACVVPPRCGDGDVNGTEVCDGSDLVDDGCEANSFCNATCTACLPIPAECGDGSNAASEFCDGSDAANTGCGAGTICNASCTACIPGGGGDCGNGTVDGGETCDPTAAVTGCDAGFTCSNDCSECITCGDGEVNGTEECDFFILFGDPGTCDYATQYCSPTCRCEDHNVSIVPAESYMVGSPVYFAFTSSLSVQDAAGLGTGGVSNILMLFVNWTEGVLVDVAFTDSLVWGQSVEGAVPSAYELQLQYHKPIDPSVFDGTDFVYPEVLIAVLLDENGGWSNLVEVSYDEAIFEPGAGARAFGEDAECNVTLPLTECLGGAPASAVNIECVGEVGAAVCTDLGPGAAFALLDWELEVDVANDALDMFFTFANDVDDLLPYWTLWMVVAGAENAALVPLFLPYDEIGAVVEGEQLASFTLGGLSSLFEVLSDVVGFTVTDLLELTAIVYDVAHTDFMTLAED
jgi:hypothetical protein